MIKAKRHKFPSRPASYIMAWFAYAFRVIADDDCCCCCCYCCRPSSSCPFCCGPAILDTVCRWVSTSHQSQWGAVRWNYLEPRSPNLINKRRCRAKCGPLCHTLHGLPRRPHAYLWRSASRHADRFGISGRVRRTFREWSGACCWCLVALLCPLWRELYSFGSMDSL